MLSLSTIEGRQFLKELTKSQSAWADIIFKNSDIDPQLLDDTLKKSQPLLVKGPLNYVSKQNMIKIVQDIVGLVEAYQPEFKEDLARLKSRYEEFYGLTTKGSEFDLLQWANKHTISPMMLGQLIDWSLRPKKMALAKIVQPLVFGKVDWESQNCPICGEPADIAILLKENGERNLGCSCCQITWRYARLKCISCENTNPESLKYYFVEEAPEQQIHYCQACNSYLKTIDYRFANEKLDDLMLLNYMTVHLDVLAEKNGLGSRNFN